MTLGLILAFVGLHFIIAVVSWLGAWVDTETDDGLAGALAGTPLDVLVGPGSVFAGGLNNINLASPIAFGMESMEFMGALFSFNYTLFDGGGVVGMFGTILGVLGHGVAAWLMFQLARTVAGSILGFVR